MKKYRVMVWLKHGVLDVQGKAIENGLASTGVEGITGVTVGKVIEMNVEGSDGKSRIEKVCKDLLANPVIERFEIAEVV